MQNLLGIDAGSVAVGAALVEHGELVRLLYAYHYGDVRQALCALLADLDWNTIDGVALTASCPEFDNLPRFNNQLAVIAAVKQAHPDARSLLVVGGETFGLTRFGANGDYLGCQTNPACAAGTGSFLEQQARRLGFATVEQLAASALANTGRIPKIATRCAVFAKTDLTHAQQEGYSIPEICDGLCSGLAMTIADTAFSEGPPPTPLVLAGGVSLNGAVVKHLAEVLGQAPVVDPWSQGYGAVGAALLLATEPASAFRRLKSVEELVADRPRPRPASNPPLALKLSSFPDFGGHERWIDSGPEGVDLPVEADLYEHWGPGQGVFLGVDIGSTSTKAVLMTPDKRLVAGFYTKTMGNPVAAAQRLLRAIEGASDRLGSAPRVLGAGTTGSGRKLIGKVLGADLVVDEITAQARAAFELDPEVDTIVEIGGQDAKFTTLKDGMVTFSAMNRVCAAGTGSFIEELGLKLGCPMEEYSGRAEGRRSPATSDRCTVFMERDVNHFLQAGYTRDEVLASVLHSVRDNYLLKVAVEANIGAHVCFQGATAKNKALLMAFEQKLGRPIRVSRYCHLTGAYGTALLLAEAPAAETRFRGTGLHRQSIPVENETCPLCRNHCKLTKMTIQGRTEAFGFLCGRDYDTQHFVEAGNGFDFVEQERKILTAAEAPVTAARGAQTVGIPAGLALYEDVGLWRRFFAALGVPTVVGAASEGRNHGKAGRADFCAPMASFLGQAGALAAKSDKVFLPIELEARDKDRDVNRWYCYYTQFVPSLAAGIPEVGREKALMPVISSSPLMTKIELFKALRPLAGYWQISTAYDQALEFRKENEAVLHTLYEANRPTGTQIGVVLLGRPYTVLDPNHNQKIPSLFAGFGVKTFFQDMLEPTKDDTRETEALLQSLHWNYAAKILAAAWVAAKEPGLYPVYITSFRCAPDSFVLDAFKKIMERFAKPYLVLELDEHGSNVGYETRVEAAVRAFQNHHGAQAPVPGGGIEGSFEADPRPVRRVEGRTLLIPSWDDLSAKLVEAVYRRNGYDARMVPLTPQALRLGAHANTGQCLPVNLIFQSFVEHMETHGLDPARTAVWVLRSAVSCNLPMYPMLLKSSFERYGKGYEQVLVYSGDLALTDISLPSLVDAYFAYQFGGALRRMACRTRPYETEPGATDRVLAGAVDVFYEAFLNKTPLDKAVHTVVDRFLAVPVKRTPRPRVAVFGDIYVRDNDLMNQDLVRFIERAGGEVLTTPLSDYVRMVSGVYLRRWLAKGDLPNAVANQGLVLMVDQLEKVYSRQFNRVLQEAKNGAKVDVAQLLKDYDLTLDQEGESVDNLVKIHTLVQSHKLALLVQASPAFCCAGLVTEAMAARIEAATGVPLVSLTYDGTEESQNEKIVPYLKWTPRVTGT